MSVTRALLLLGLSLCVGACGSSNSPTAATPTSTATGTANIGSFFVTAEVTAADTVFNVTIQVRETSGKASITVTAIVLTGTDGSRLTLTPTSAATATAGGSTVVESTIHVPTVSAPPAQETALVSFTDANGHTGTTTGSASVTRLVYYSLVGTVREPAGQGIGGAAVLVTGCADILGANTTAASNGYYVFPRLLAGTPCALRVTATGYVTATPSVTLTADTVFDVTLAPPAPPASNVHYAITGSARGCGATYQNATGGVNQSNVTVPFDYSWNGAYSGEFLYISCQINNSNDHGSITVSIYRNGALLSTADANGFPNIATASGSY